MSTFEATLRWYGVLVAASAAFAPWVWLLCARLPDRGAAITKPLALLGMIFPLWFLAGLDLLPYSTAGLWVTVVVVGIGGWGRLVVRRGVEREWLISLLVVELIAAAAFLGYVWLRGYTPEIQNTEKPMDMALLSASARTDSVPPEDPWFAGESINYYYLGYFIHGSMSRMAGVPTQFGFNLALATTFSMALTAAAGLGFNAVRRWASWRLAVVAAVAAAFLLVIAGNLYASRQLIDDPQATFDASWWPGVNSKNNIGWRSSRVICDGPREENDCASAQENIDEFPSFSFLLGDLHPHVMALPYTVVALSLAMNLLFLGPLLTSLGTAVSMGSLVATGVVTGALYALNSWDFPTFLLVVLVACLLGLRGLAPRERWIGAGVVAVASVVAWVPFYLHFSAPIGTSASDLPSFMRDLPVISTLLTTIAAFRGERTSVGEFLTFFGIPYAVSVWLLASWYGRAHDEEPEPVEGSSQPLVSLRSLLPLLVVVLVVGLLLPAPILVLCGVPLVIAIVQLSRMRSVGPRMVATGLFCLGYLLVIGAEFFYIQDLFDRRMNTIFKVYYQAWTLFAVASAVAVVAIVQESRAVRVVRPAVAALFALVAAAGLAYPAVASYQWTDHFRDWQGLDGLAYVTRFEPDEAAAIAWLQDNTSVDDVVLEGAGCSYGQVHGVAENRASAFGGVPAVIGWGWHETQWRNGQPEVQEIGQRQSDVRTMYGDPTSTLLDEYGVTLLYVGIVERDGDPGCRPLEEPYSAVAQPGYPGSGWEQVFASGDVAIYRRVAASAASSGG